MATKPYTSEETLDIISSYKNGEDLETMAVRLERSTKALIAKLVKEGVYNPRPTKARQPNKAEIVSDICDLLEVEALTSLEKCTKEDLNALIRGIIRLTEGVTI